MRRSAVLTAIVVVGLGAAGIAAQRGGGGRGGGIPPTGAIEKIKDNLYKIPGAGSNTTVFVGTDGVVLVDTKLANNGEAIMKQVRTVTDKPVTTLINTHVHPDHNGSNDYFKAARPTIAVVAHENTKKRVLANPKPIRATIPDVTFENVAWLGNGADRIELYYFGPGHTDGDAFVVFPALRAMCIGDLMAWNMAPLIDPATKGSVIALPDTLEKAVKGIKGVDLVIEGHGNVNTWAGLKAYAEFNRALLNEAKKALANKQTPEQALAALEKNKKFAVFLKEELLKDLEYGGTPKSRALINLNVAFQELKGEPVTTNFGPPRGGGAPRGGGPPPGGGPGPGPAPAPPAK
ncbi:MAG TPA: MBL fold metallo-hydrolase [Vicinamibacterales bacterium]|nr:MBL fold metallo-hydrolase [Vicinamibacterales bacterium]